MIDLYAAIPVINFVLICVIGSWLCWDRRRNRRAAAQSTEDRQVTRAMADRAAKEAATCTAVIDRLGTNGHTRRRLHVVHDKDTGRSSWHWEH